MKIREKAYAKINIALDVLGKRPDNYHELDMVMHMVDLYDTITIEVNAGKSGITLNSNREKLPLDNTNLAYKAAVAFFEYIKEEIPEVKIDIEKNIPMAAGLAGGSSDAAAVLRALNYLAGDRLSVEELKEIAAKIGSDVPFCVDIDSPCQRASGTGTELMPLPALDSYVVISKPDIEMSTPAVYKAFDEIDAVKHPNIFELVASLAMKDKKGVYKNMINLLELVSLKEEKIKFTKEKMQELAGKDRVLMSGSGPSVFALLETEDEAYKVFKAMKEINEETFAVRTRI